MLLIWEGLDSENFSEYYKLKDNHWQKKIFIMILSQFKLYYDL